MTQKRQEKTRKKRATTEDREERQLTTRDELTEFLLYTAPDGQVKVECVLHDETIWLPQSALLNCSG